MLRSYATSAEFQDLTARMHDIERDVISLTRKLRDAEAALLDIRNKRSVLFGQMLAAANA